MSDDDRDSLFGSPPSSPVLKGKSPTLGLALPGTRTGHRAASAENNNENVGTIAPLGLHQIFNRDNSPVALSDSFSSNVTLSRPPAVEKSSNPSRRPATGKSTKAVPVQRVLAQPLDLPESVSAHEKGLLRSHPSLLGTAGQVAGLNTMRFLPRGYAVSNPIVIEDEEKLSSVPQIPRFTASPMATRRPTMPKRSSSSPYSPISTTSRTILSNAILKSALTAKDSSSFRVSPVLIALKQNPRFQALLKDLVCFIRSAESCSIRRDRITNPSSPKRRKTRHGAVPAGAQHWNVPFPFAEGEAPESYYEQWRASNAKRLLADLVDLLRGAQKAVNKENYWAPAPRKVKSPPPSTEETPPGDMVPDELSKTKSVNTWLHGLPEQPAIGDEASLDELWHILREFGVANTQPLLAPPSEDSSLPSAALDPSIFDFGDNDIAAFPLWTTDATVSKISDSTSNFGPFPDLHGNYDMIDPSLLEGVPSGSIAPDFDVFSCFSGLGTGTEDADALTMSMSPTSSSGVLPTPTSPVTTPANIYSPQPTYSELVGKEPQFVSPSGGLGNPIDLESMPLDSPSCVLLEKPQDTVLPIPTTPAPLPESAASRKQNVLVKARAHREQLLNEIEQAKKHLWEYTIESGVIMNLEHATS